jgi:hypothetical protein
VNNKLNQTIWVEVALKRSLDESSEENHEIWSIHLGQTISGIRLDPYSVRGGASSC